MTRHLIDPHNPHNLCEQIENFLCKLNIYNKDIMFSNQTSRCLETVSRAVCILHKNLTAKQRVSACVMYVCFQALIE